MLERPIAVKTQFHVLYRQFILRIVDLESLSSKADVIRLIGQLASILIMFSLIQAMTALLFNLNRIPVADRVTTCWAMEFRLIAMTMLVVGLFALLSWESTFPDRRDMMVLGPLPIRASTIFLAKVAASGVALGLAVLALNGASGLTWPLVWASPGILGIIRSFAAYWATMVAAGIFLYSSVLTLQGMTVLLLSRRLFLRLSAFLQLTVFCLFLSTYFLEPQIVGRNPLAAPENQQLIPWLPTYWFLGFLNGLNGSIPPALVVLEHRAWTGLILAVFGAGSMLLLFYLRGLGKIVEQPEVVPGSRSPRWSPRVGNSLQTAILNFCMRSLLRSRQHRVVVAFYLGIGFAIALSTLNISEGPRDPSGVPADLMGLRLLISTVVLLTFLVVGVRVAFSVPVSLPANWIFRITEVRPAQEYIAATTRAFIVLAVMPIAAASTGFSLPFEPPVWVAAHVLLLVLLGLCFVAVALMGFNKVPMTCSYLPGKANIQFAFWAYILLLVRLTEFGARFEQRSLRSPTLYAVTLGVLSLLALLTRWRERSVARTAVLHFEETAPIDVLELGLNRD